LRGDIYWADVASGGSKEQACRSPVLIISYEAFNNKSGTVIAVAITDKKPKAGFPLTLELSESRLSEPSWVRISHIRTLSTKQLVKKIGRVSIEEIDAVLEGLMDIIG